jgi:hypothetical protein
VRKGVFTKQVHKNAHTAAQLFLLVDFVVGGGGVVS